MFRVVLKQVQVLIEKTGQMAEQYVKFLQQIPGREELSTLLDTKKQREIVAATRGDVLTNEQKNITKRGLEEIAINCLPNPDGTLKGSRRLSNKVGADLDDVPESQAAEVEKRIMQRKDEVGLLGLQRSARRKLNEAGEWSVGYHIICKRVPELTQEQNILRIADILEVEPDMAAKDITRVFFCGPTDDFIYLDDRIFETYEVAPAPGETFNQKKPAAAAGNRPQAGETPVTEEGETEDAVADESSRRKFDKVCLSLGIDLGSIAEHPWHPKLLLILSKGLHRIMSEGQLKAVIREKMPEFKEREDCDRLIYEAYHTWKSDFQLSKELLDIVKEVNMEMQSASQPSKQTEDCGDDEHRYYRRIRKNLPMGLKDATEAGSLTTAMARLIGVLPALAARATGVKTLIHNLWSRLNLIAHITGPFASGKGSIDPVVEACVAELKQQDNIYYDEESEWRRKKRSAKNKEEQPEEPKRPVRVLTMNSTVAQITDRLQTLDKQLQQHAFSFTPESDTVSKRWKSDMSDFSVMVRQAYDGSPYDREAKSVDSENAHISSLLWNITLCGTEDAVHRVVGNTTDGLLSRIAIARTPDNTFEPLEDNPRILTDRQRERIWQVAHLLSLMKGEVELPALEKRGKRWLEKIRVEAKMTDDRPRAELRKRTAITVQRMVVVIMLCRVAEQLIKKHGFQGAENKLNDNPNLWKEMTRQAQIPQMLDMYDVLADYLLDCTLFFFRERMERASANSCYSKAGTRQRIGKNDVIFERLAWDFTFDEALAGSQKVKGEAASRKQVQQMLKNWKAAGIIVDAGMMGHYRKTIAQAA